jgi:hypothetical protein
MAWTFDFLAMKIAVGLAGSIVLIMAGAISARQSIVGAILLGFVMGGLFFLMRWSGWSLMEGGFAETARFLVAGPSGWAGYLEAVGISGYWLVEAISMLVPALIGCVAGQERPA